MKLCTLFEKVPYLVETRGNMVTEIGELCSDSRAKVENGLFFCGANAGELDTITTVQEEMDQIMREWMDSQ